MSSSQIIGNNAGTAVPVAVDSSGNVRVAVSGPVSANLYADDGSGTVPVAGEATGELKAQALGTTSGGVLTPLLVDSQGRVVTSGGVTGPTGPAGQSSTFYPYRTNTTPGTGDPGTGLVSWDNTSQLLSTQIQINHIDQNNVDIDIFLALLSVGDTVTIQDRSNSANYQRWTVSGTPTSQPNYVQVPVTFDAGAWSAPNNHQIIVAFLNAGPVGPTGPTGATGSAAWPSTSSVLLAGDGSSVNVGSGLSLSAGTLTTTQMPAVASTAVNRWRMNETSGTTFTDSIASQVLTYSPLGSSVLTYGANRVMAISPSVDFAPTASDATSVLSCASASFPSVSSAGQARMMEAYLRFDNIANPAGTLFLLMSMILNVNNRIVVYSMNGTVYVYCERNSVVVSNNWTGPALPANAAPYGGNRTMHILVAEDPNTVNVYINGQVYSGSQPTNRLYAVGTYTFSLLNAPYMLSTVSPPSTPTSAEIAEITLHNGLIPAGYASTQAYATARAMLVDKRW